MSYDITFCSKISCSNNECKRNQNNYNFENIGNRPISIAPFKDCKDWEE